MSVRMFGGRAGLKRSDAKRPYLNNVPRVVAVVGRKIAANALQTDHMVQPRIVDKVKGVFNLFGGGGRHGGGEGCHGRAGMECVRVSAPLGSRRRQRRLDPMTTRSK